MEIAVLKIKIYRKNRSAITNGMRFRCDAEGWHANRSVILEKSARFFIILGISFVVSFKNIIFAAVKGKSAVGYG